MSIPVIEKDQPSTDDRPGFLVRTDYDAGFVDAVKELPRRERAWVPEEEAWWVATPHLDRVRDLCLHHFGAVRIVDGDGLLEDELVQDGQGLHRQERLFE